MLDKDIILFDDGFSHGRGVFETIKIIGNKAEFLEEHLKRINSSLKYFAIDKIITENEVINYIKENNLKDCALNIFVSEKNTIYKTRKDFYIDADKDKLFKATISSVKRNSTSKLLSHKSFNYMENIMEKTLAKNKGFDEVLFINEKGYLAEGAVSNIFFTNNGKIYTSSKDSGLLNGIIRQFIIDKFEVIETDITLEDVYNFQSSFITNSLMGVRPLESIDNINFNVSKETEIIKDYFINKGY